LLIYCEKGEIVMEIPRRYIDEAWKQVAAKSKDKDGNMKSLYEHTSEVMECAYVLWRLGYISNIHELGFLLDACMYHDAGKLTKEFQKRVHSEKHISFDKEKELPHSLLSVFAVPIKQYDRENFYILAYAIMHHHRFNYTYIVEDGHIELIKDIVHQYPQWFHMLKNSQLGHIEDKTNFNRKIRLTGLLMRCDYAASGNYTIEYSNDFLEHSLRTLNYDWNNMQRFCQEHGTDNVLVIGETGMGKTEGALWWIGNHKGFYFLPVRTAITAIYKRIRDMVHNDKIDTRIALLHSDTLSQYLSDSKGQKEWQELDIFQYAERGRRFSLPLIISTVDQLFDFVFRNDGYQMKLATLAYSKVVIDEIQMYDAELLAYVIHGLELVVQVGGKVNVMTATLPPFVRDLLKCHITFVEGMFTKHAEPRHSIKVLHKRLNSDDILSCYYENEKEGRSNKILVICNTISEAQRMYDRIHEANDNIHVDTFHTRFIGEDKKKKEEAILEFGRTDDGQGNIDKRTGIWITTSICEASLDIDFDYLFTELQYTTSLLQRLGRCNRKGVKVICGYNCYVYTEIDEKLIKYKGRTRGFIDADLYHLSVQSLEHVDGPVTEEEKMQWLEEYFTTEKVQNSEYYQDYQRAYKGVVIRDEVSDLFDIPDQLRHILSIDIIPSTVVNEEKSRERYERAIEVLHNKSCSLKERLSAKNEIQALAVPVNGTTYYRLKGEGYHSQEIPIVDLPYTKEKGLCTTKDLINAFSDNQML